MISFVRAFADNYIWLLIDEQRKTVVAVDPGDAEPVLDYLHAHQLRLEGILLTHHHADHVGGLPKLVYAFPEVAVYGPDDARLPQIPQPIRQDSDFSIQHYHFQRFDIPGHTASHICYYEALQGILFPGDTLFSAGCGRVFDGTLDLLYQSLLRLKNLPEATKIYCGHEYTRQNLRFAASVEPRNARIREYGNQLQQHHNPSLPSTIGLEKQINPFLRLEEAEVMHFAKKHGCQSLDPLSILIKLREEKNCFNA